MPTGALPNPIGLGCWIGAGMKEMPSPVGPGARITPAGAELPLRKPKEEDGAGAGAPMKPKPDEPAITGAAAIMTSSKNVA